ncbi:MAG: ABC transporter substrate-binding protein [Halobacteriota archaeon]|nr:ABC transporter substrate-binding protein [Halobacteriota archaeon]
MGKWIGLILVLIMLATLSAGCLGPEEEVTPTPTVAPPDATTPSAEPTATPIPEPQEPVKLVRMGGQDMVQRLGTGDIAGFIGWEPYNAEAVVEGNGKILMNSSEIWSHHPCCVVAYDYNWYESVGDANETLKRIAWVHMKSTEWINEAKDSNSSNHTKLIQHAENFTKRSPEVIEMALANIDFDYTTDAEGTETYIQKISEFGVFDESKWEQSGYQNASDYSTSLINDEYVNWAIENSNMPTDEIKLNETVDVRFGYLIEDLHQVAFWIAWQEGWFEDVGINVTVAQGAPFANGAFEMTKGFKQNEVDVGYLGIAPATVHRINSNDFSVDDARINVITGVNYIGSAIAVSEEIDSMEDLAGETVGFPGKGTVQHLLFLTAAENAGLTVEE